VNAQLRLIADFEAGKVTEVPLNAKCEKCSRPHLPYGPLCGPCHTIAAKAYMDAPAAEEDK
jgi:hypothetical protein